MSVTVIVPVYNVSAYLRAGLESVLAAQAQVKSKSEKGKGFSVEIICVDDGSTDGCAEMLDEYVEQVKRSGEDRCVDLIVVHQQNRGVSAARNAGIERATGEVLLFMDPDDVVETDWIARMVAGIEGVDAVLAGYCENGQPRLSRDEGAVYDGAALKARFWRAFFGYRLRDIPKMLLPGGMWKRCGREMAGVWRCAVRRAVLGDLRFDERLPLYEDAMFLSQLALRARRVRIVGDCGYHWFVRARGAMLSGFNTRMVGNKFAVRDARRTIDPKMSAWRGSFALSALEVLRATKSLRQPWRYLTFKPYLDR